VANDRSTAAFQGFLVEAKRYWMSEIWGALKDDYSERARNREPKTAEEVAALMEPSPLYWFYAWLERHIQRAKYSGRYGLTVALRDAKVAPPAGVRLELDPAVDVPEYYRVVDTHQHPGNLVAGPNAGLVYKASAGSTQPGATRGYELHERFADFLAAIGTPRRVLDLGCGFGKSALPIAQHFRDAEVTAIDLSAPCLELAAVEAAGAGAPNLAYAQADLLGTRYPDASFDLVTSTMVLHELDTPALRQAFRESHRLLAPGGTVVHLDFQVKDPFLEFIHYGHGRRNNEPYMESLNRLDVAAELAEAGFEQIRALPFEETPGATAPDWSTWRFPWTAFVAQKPTGRAGRGGT
jgi:ubiquinone/menaquinone biosynthesis C-methylase UbiE